MLRQFAALSATLGILAGQPAAPAWKEFSIGPARAGRIVRTSNIRQGMLQTNSISLKSLIGVATGVAPERITAPAWLDSEHYAVTAALSDESRLRLRTRSPEDPRVIEEFRSLLTRARQLELDAVCEVHDEVELQRAIDGGADIIGVNSRDLRTFELKLDTVWELAAKIPSSALRIAESGIAKGSEIREFYDFGYQAFLVGETLMRADDPGKKLRQI